MALKKYRPTSPGRRFASSTDTSELSSARSERGLSEPVRSRGGRNSQGRITVRHRGGGHKRRYRRIDFRRDKAGIPARVSRIEYDPNRTARIALLSYADGEKRYILAPQGLQVGAVLVSGPEAEPVVGNALPLSRIPPGMMVHNIELSPGRGGKIVRTAGAGAQLMSREASYANVKLPSGEIRMINVACMATVGQVGHAEHGAVNLGKAGRARWRGVRPTVRGVVMNPVDHPMGGGEGRSSGGGHPVSPWGQPAKGGRTRPKRKPSNKLIVKRRR